MRPVLQTGELQLPKSIHVFQIIVGAIAVSRSGEVCIAMTSTTIDVSLDLELMNALKRLKSRMYKSSKYIVPKNWALLAK